MITWATDGRIRDTSRSEDADDSSTPNRPDIAVFLPSLSAGGAQRVMLTTATGLAERGYSVDLVVGNLSGQFESEIPESVSVIDLGARKLPKLSAVGNLRPVREYLMNREPRVFISSMNHVNVVALVAWKTASTDSRIIVTEHNDPRALKRGSMKNRIVYSIASLVYPWSNSIVGVSDGVVGRLSDEVGIPEHELTRIYNPVVTADLIAESKQPCDHPWTDDDVPVLLNVGRLTEQKNQDLLLRSFATLRSRRDARLIIVGKGERESELLALAEKLGVEEHVAIINWIDNLYALMANADTFVLSSRYEGLPTVLIEALACGCPVVSTDCPSGPREIIGEDEYGTLVTEFEPSALADGTETQLESPVDEATLRERGREFSVHRCIDKYEQLVQELL